MAKIQKATSYPGHEKRKTTPIHDQIQIALALADQQTLVNLLVNSKPFIVSFDESLTRDKSLREVAKFELYEKGKKPEEWTIKRADVQPFYWEKITCKMEVPVSKKNYAVDCVIKYGYQQKVEIELVHHSSGEMLSYNWSMGQSGEILVEIKTEIQSWADTLRQIKRYQTELRIPRAILVCDTLTELEAQGFMSQGVSIYPATYLTLPIYADCSICVNGSCPMSGTQNSPVTMCRGFDTIDEWLSNDKQIEGSG
jgi:hypothetical protein